MSQYYKLLLLAGLLPLSGFAQNIVLDIGGSGYFMPANSQSNQLNDGISAANTVAQNTVSSGGTNLNALALAEGKTYIVNAINGQGSLTVMGEILLHQNSTLIVQGDISAGSIVVENGATVKANNSNSGNGNTASITANIIKLESLEETVVEKDKGDTTVEKHKTGAGKSESIGNTETPQLLLLASQVNVNRIQGVGVIRPAGQNSIVNICSRGQISPDIQLKGINKAC
jgi:hypothetical protein